MHILSKICLTNSQKYLFMTCMMTYVPILIILFFSIPAFPLKWQKLCKLNFTNETLLQKYKKYRNLLNRTKDKAKIYHYRNLFESNKCNPTATWRLINKIIHYKNTDSKLPSKIEYNNTATSSVDDISNILNNHFVNIGPTLANSIPDQNNFSSAYASKKIKDSIFLENTDPEEILNIITSLNTKKAVGYDGISSKILQILKHVLSPVLSNIFNKSMQIGVFPEKLKIAKILPLHKGGKTNEVNNYRPISVLSSLSKVYEKIINKRLTNFLNKHNVISDYQFRFRQGKP